MHRRTGHDARALALAFSPDGSLLASGHVDGSIHLWDMARGEEVQVRLRHEQEMVSALAFSPDGRTLATGGVDSTLKLWDVTAARKGEARRELVRQPAAVTALAFVAEGTAAGHRPCEPRAARDGRRDAPADGDAARARRRPSTCSARSPDGRRLAVGSQDRTVRVFDVETQAQIALSTPHKKPPSSLCFFADGNHLASVALENTVQLWDLQAGGARGVAVGARRRQLRGHRALRRRRPHRGRAGGRAHPRLGPGRVVGRPGRGQTSIQSPNSWAR